MAAIDTTSVSGELVFSVSLPWQSSSGHASQSAPMEPSSRRVRGKASGRAQRPLGSFMEFNQVVEQIFGAYLARMKGLHDEFLP